MARRRGRRVLVGFYTDKKKRIRPITLPLWRLRRLHAQRSLRAQIIDEALEARRAPSPEYWIRHMNRTDVVGVDLFPTPTASSKKLTPQQRFAINYQLIQDALERTFGHKTLLHKIQYEVVTDPKKWKHPGVLAYCTTKAKPIKIVYGPEVYKAIMKGEITNRKEFRAYEAMVHENLHALVGDAKYNSLFEEGSTELLAQRFVLNTVQMPKRLREELLKKPEYTYEPFVKNVASIALLMADGDPVKAMRWLERTKTPSRKEQDRIISEMNRKIGRILSYVNPEASKSQIKAETLRFCGVGKDKYKIAMENKKRFLKIVKSMLESPRKEVREKGKRIMRVIKTPYWWLRV